MAEDQPEEETAEQLEAGEEVEIELEEPRGRRGWGVGILIVLVIIAAALAWYLFWTIAQGQEREQRAREIREQSYQAQLAKIGTDLAEAIKANEQGDVAAAIQALEAATSRIGDVGSSAAAAGDDEYSQVIGFQKKTAQQALEAATAIQAELQELLADKLREVRQALGVKESAAAEPEEQEPAEAEGEPAGPEEAEEPGELEPSAAEPAEPPRPPVPPVPPPSPPR